jgi:GGDEF-like domain
MVTALSEQLRRERAELARSSHARRFEVVSLILDSAPITAGHASTQLSYDLRRRHTAAVLWTDPCQPDQAALAQAADALGTATRARQTLTVIASSSSVWAWLPSPRTPTPPLSPPRPQPTLRSGSRSDPPPPGPTASAAATSTPSPPSG